MFDKDKPFFILDDDGKVRQASTDQYLAWTMAGGVEQTKRVDYTQLNDDYYVSTVFLGIDHNHFGGEPLLFETMVFGGPHDGIQWRYHTLEQAQTGHQVIVTALRAGIEPEYNRNDPSWVEQFFNQYTGE